MVENEGRGNEEQKLVAEDEKNDGGQHGYSRGHKYCH